MFELSLTLAVVASTTFCILLLILPSRYVKHSPPKSIQNGSSKANEAKISVQVLVLGDIGRSPRMQYHAMSIAKHGGSVDVIGYVESTIPSSLVENPLVTIVLLEEQPQILRSKELPFIIAGPLKVLHQAYSIFMTLGYRVPPARWLLVQNPPSIPTLIVALIICFLRNTHLIIDWHNYGWTILAGIRGPSHPFVKIYKLYEQILGRWAPTANFTVTEAMSRQLKNPPVSIRSPIFTLHDRPAAIFQPIESAEARKTFLERLQQTKDDVAAIMAGRRKLLISSTSWTPDEDFSLLLDALTTYSEYSKKPGIILPKISAIITGKGPQKDLYLHRIAELEESGKLDNVTISTVFLPIEDYAKLLACADLGVCLHKSTSGVDLPMKVVDMFGAGLPVVGYSAYESWDELVREYYNGRGFVT